MSERQWQPRLETPAPECPPAIDLVRWFAQPLTEAEGQLLLRIVQGCARERQRLDAFSARCHELIAHFWLGRSIDAEVQTLLASFTGEREQAAVHLIAGQLHMSRSLQSGRRHLEEGFRRAAHLLASGDYFQVLRRHEILYTLPLSDNPAPARDLDTLLRDAQVIRRLQGKPAKPTVTPRPHFDTLD